MFCFYFFSRSQKAITSLLEELDVEIYNQWNNGSKIIHSSDDVITTYSSPLPPLSYLALLDLWWFTYKLHSLDYSLRTSIVAVIPLWGVKMVIKKFETCQDSETANETMDLET